MTDLMTIVINPNGSTKKTVSIMEAIDILDQTTDHFPLGRYKFKRPPEEKKRMRAQYQRNYRQRKRERGGYIS